ncbi:MAG: ABC transporter ATP-binding protein [Candidatus Binatia bacterium]|jgi:ABC-type polysaccharide/polyol phosphate transport system ATPase subunit
MAIATRSPSSFEDDPPEIQPGGGGAEPAAIRLSGVRKRFRKYTVRGGYSTLKTSLMNRMFRRKFPAGNYLDVLNGVDLDVAPGLTLGIIGRNGSGKSTLLKIMAGIIRPDGGAVEVRGRVSPLIELGAGFHPDFSGRENVYLNGLVIGMSKAETEQRFDSIVEFAGLADAIDDPVRTYSSGMYMRLGFSVAVHADPDVLLIDEILAVGDESFVGRCYERIAAFQAAGKTIVMVSHGLESIERWCHEAVWIDGGRIAARGYPTEVTRLYHAAVGAEDGPPAKERSLRDSLRPGRLAAVIRVLEPPTRTPETWHHVARVLLDVENVGDTVWRSLPPTRRGTVMVGGRLHSGERFLGETLRALIPRDVHPGERVCVEFKFKLPGSGRYRVDVDLVNEGICWFAERGSTPLPVEVTI